MKLLNYFKKKSKSKNKITIEPDEEYIKSTLIHVDYLTSEDPIMYILFTFSNSYCPSAIDIVNNMIFQKSIYIQTSDDIETEELDEDGSQIINSIPKNYLLMPLQVSYIESLVNNIDIANPFLNEIINEVYDNIDSSYFANLINAGIMNASLFMNKDVNKDINMITIVSDLYSTESVYTDIPSILKKLPSEFTGIDLFNILWFRHNLHPYKLCNFITIKLSDYEIHNIFNGVIKNPTKENLYKLSAPLYKRSVDEDELIHGDLNSHEIDQIFQEQYNRFSAVINDNTSYMDIDEVISEDDPEYNNLQNNNEEVY